MEAELITGARPSAIATWFRLDPLPPMLSPTVATTRDRLMAMARLMNTVSIGWVAAGGAREPSGSNETEAVRAGAPTPAPAPWVQETHITINFAPIAAAARMLATHPAIRRRSRRSQAQSAPSNERGASPRRETPRFVVRFHDQEVTAPSRVALRLRW